MADSRLKLLLQTVAVRTQFPPFVWLYRLLYAGAIRLCVSRLRRVRGARSIHLWRGLTGQRPLWGASDIDLLVMVAGVEHVPGAVQAYDRLRRFVPMLAEGQVTIVHPLRLEMMYRYMPWHRSRLGAARQSWVRLWGEDIGQYLPDLSWDVRDYVWEEFKGIWGFHVREFEPDDPRSLWLRRYDAYKALADSARIARIVDGADPRLSRDDAIVEAAQAYPDVAPTLHEAQSWRRRAMKRRPLPADEVTDALLCLARRALAPQPIVPRHPRRLRLMAADPDAVRELMGQESLSRLVRARRVLEGIDAAIVTPLLYLRPFQRVRMGRQSMDGHWIDTFLLALIGRRPPVANLREFLRVLGPCPHPVTVAVSDGTFAFVVNRTWKLDVAVPATRPDAFPSPEHTAPFEEGLRISTGQEMVLPLRGPDDLLVRTATMVASLRSRAACLLNDRQYLMRLWEAGRMVCIVQQADRAVAEAPVISPQAVEALARATPEDEPTLRAIHAEYRRGVKGQASRAGQHRAWVAEYSRRLEGAVPVLQQALAEMPLLREP